MKAGQMMSDVQTNSPIDAALARLERKQSASRNIVAGIVLAIVAAALGFSINLIQDQRKRDMDFVDLQIEKLYGPLLAFSQAALRAKDDLIAKRRPETKDYFDPNRPPSKADVEIFRLWMTKLFQPMNLEMEKAITQNAQLIQGGHIYPVFRDFIMHAESYKVTIAKWKDTDPDQNPRYLEGSENKAIRDFPAGFDDCVQQRYDAMLARRAHLRNFWFSLFATYQDPAFPDDCK